MSFCVHKNGLGFLGIPRASLDLPLGLSSLSAARWAWNPSSVGASSWGLRRRFLPSFDRFLRVISLWESTFQLPRIIQERLCVYVWAMKNIKHLYNYCIKLHLKRCKAFLYLLHLFTFYIYLNNIKHLYIYCIYLHLPLFFHLSEQYTIYLLDLFTFIFTLTFIWTV